jgi:hypothetical protein
VDIATVRERVLSVESQIATVNETIFGFGGTDTLKSRLQKAEDAVVGLKEMVLENREVAVASMKEIQNNADEKLKGFFKIFVLTITAASIVIGAMFTVIWAELKTVEMARIEVQR